MNCLYCGDYGCEECSSSDVESSRMYLELKTKLQASREEIDKLKAEVKKKKNRIGILNRSLRRLKKGGERDV